MERTNRERTDIKKDMRTNIMKIALCISGHLRTWHKNYPSWKQFLIEPLQQKGCHIDIYIHTYQINGIRTEFGSGHNNSLDKQLVDSDFVKSILQPKEIVVEDSDTIQRMMHTEVAPNIKSAHSPILGPYTISNALCMYYKIWRCGQLVKANDGYDIIIRMRPDMMFIESIDTDLVFLSLFYDRIYVPKSNNDQNLGNNSGYIDHFAIGSAQLMRYYNDCFVNIHAYLNGTDLVGTGERILKRHLQDMRVVETPIYYRLTQ